MRDAGLAHAAFDHPGDDTLAPIWARLRGLSDDEVVAIAAREIFAGVNARVALPKLQATIDDWRPDLVVRDSVEFASLVAAERAGVRHARVAVHSVSFEEVFPALVDAPIDALRALAGLSPDEGASLRAEAVFSSFPTSLDCVPASSRMRAPFRARVVDETPSSAHASWATRGRRAAARLHHVRDNRRNHGGRPLGLPHRARRRRGPARARAAHDRPGLDVGALGAIPANVHVEEWIPQRDVLPHAAALVCHGGSGTLLGGLAAGVPVVVVPVGADQPHNGRLVAAAGAGLTLTKPDAGALRAAIQTALDAPALRVHARRFADEIAAMPTIDSAIDELLGMT